MFITCNFLDKFGSILLATTLEPVRNNIKTLNIFYFLKIEIFYFNFPINYKAKKTKLVTNSD